MTAVAQLVRRLDDLERDRARLREELAEVHQAREQAERERDPYHELYIEMMERCRKLELGLRGQRAERLPSGDPLSLGMLELVLGQQGADDVLALAETGEQTVREHKRKKPTGRKPIPDHLPRVEIEIIPDEVKRLGLDAFERIGQDVTEVLERRPASVVVARIVKPKFVAKDRDRGGKTDVFCGETPELPIPRGLAGPGLLADTIVKRWQDHLPLNRLEGIYAREGIELPRTTVCGWHSELAPLASPLVAAMREDAFSAPYLCVDATGVLVQAKETCRSGHFWVMVVPGKHVLFEYTRNHDNDAVDEVLSGYQGMLVADAHVVYDHLYASGDVIESNCWAHCRRYFFKAMSSDPERARVALSYIASLFRIERSLATAPRKKKERLRQKHSKPIVERFYSWCDELWPSLLEDTPLYDGVRYARNQRKGLMRFLEDGRLPIGNDISERELRRQAVGRKNWLFVGSDDGARVNAVFTSLLASCRMSGVEPWSYMRDLLCLLPRWPKHRLLDLAPVHWSATAEREDVREILAADPYRELTLRA